MKKNHYFVIVIIACLTYLTGVTVINLIIDPYEEYGLIKNKKFSLSEISFPYKAFKLLEKNDYILVFGTSHSSTLSKESFGEDVINLSTSVYGYPEDVYYFLKQLDTNQIHHIKKIYYLVDFFIHDVEPKYKELHFSSQLEFYFQTLKNLGTKKIIAAFENVIKNVSGKYIQHITQNGELVFLTEKKYTARKFISKDNFKIAYDQQKYYRFIEEFCEQKNIECVFFKSILSRFFLENIDFASIENHFQELSKQINGIYSLMYIKGASDSLENFRDPTHHSFRLSQIECDILKSSEKRNSYLVTRQNLAPYLATLKKELDHPDNSEQ